VLVAVALVVLGARALAYALVPSEFSGELGGPGLPVVIVVSLALGLGSACAVLWVAQLGVRERAALAHAKAPRMPVRPLEGMGIFGAATVAFAGLESYVHWRAGLGFHGLHCLGGPVHRDALPILAALSLLAWALLIAVRHTLAWMRRTLARLRRAQAKPRRTTLRPRDERTRGAIRAYRLLARGPPVLV
jgi:hypothetical protein